MRYAYYLSKESCWCCCSGFGGSISCWIVFLSGGSEMPVILEASDSIIIGDVRPIRSMFQEHIEFDMLFVVPFKNYKVSMSRMVSASSCKLGTFFCFFMQQWSIVWLIQLPMKKTAGRSLQGLQCIFLLCSRVSL